MKRFWSPFEPFRRCRIYGITYDDVVCHQRVVLPDAAGRIPGPTPDSELVPGTGIIGDGDIAGRMPEIDAASAAEGCDIVPDVSAQIQWYMPCTRCALACAVDVLDRVTDYIVVTGVVVGIVDSCASVGLALDLKIVHMSADDPHE